MDELENLLCRINQIASGNSQLSTAQERSIISELNDFFFSTYDGLGTVRALGQDFPYFSDFHKFWHEHHEDIKSGSHLLHFQNVG